MRALLAPTLVFAGLLAGFAGSRLASEGGTRTSSLGIPAAHAAPTPRALDTQTRAALAALTPPGERRYVRSEQAVERLALAGKALQSPGRELEVPCVQTRGDICVTHALDGFFHRLDALDQRRAADHAVVTVWGNSLIAADGMVDVVRDRLQERFGDGGRGMVHVDRLSEEALRARNGHGAGWTVYNLGQGDRSRLPLGAAGTNYVSDHRGARSSFRLHGDARVEVFFYARSSSPGFVVTVDGEEVGKQGRVDDEGPSVFTLALPAGGKRMELVADGAGLVVQGIVFHAGTPGLQLDTYGLPAADSVRWLRADPKVAAAQVAARDPSLVVLMLGGVENRRIAWGQYPVERVERSMRELIARKRSQAPNASCLVVGPIDAVEGMLDEKRRGRAVTPFRERPQLQLVNAMYRRLALEADCGFFNLFAALGGSGTLRRMNRNGWLLADHVHPRGFGLDIAGELIADALLRSWQDTTRGMDAATQRALALVDTGIASELAAQQLRALADGDDRVAVVSIAGNDAERFGQRVQARLADVLGAPRDGLLSPTGRIARLGANVEPQPPQAPAHVDTEALRALAPDSLELAADALAIELLARALGR